ncbi:MAG: hypothetical protein QHJ73_16065, partial [Armatimonadota bacterium]|nr:hypothetical protein [Armatimonadota bacterium]
ARSFRFQPSAVSIVPGIGWVVANRTLDTQLANILARARPSLAGRIQVFQLRSAPAADPDSPGDYDPNDYTPNDDPDNPTASFGFAISEDPNAAARKESIAFLFGPKVYDLETGADLGLDLVNPTYVVRTE